MRQMALDSKSINLQDIFRGDLFNRKILRAGC